MVYCSHCGDHCPSIKDPDSGYICCAMCGKILDQDIFGSDPMFTKDSAGQSRLAGNILVSVESGYSASHERTLMKGKDEIRHLVNSLQVGGGDSIVDRAHRFYQIAVDKNFTRGRRTSHVAAACLYIACRQVPLLQSKKAYLLIDFSDYLQINVYVLGAVFLQLCKVLQLIEHPIVQKLVDPSLFIHRFTERLLGKRNNAISETALRIIASMKRDWMQASLLFFHFACVYDIYFVGETGRKPSGLCGAALYIAALSHGLDYSKSDVVTVVHVCEATLTKRLIEFENTESGSLTIEEFLMRADELERESYSNNLPKPGEVLCKHKDSNKDSNEHHFAHGLCRKCYNKFIKISGGLEGGSEPPAFQRAERLRMEAAKKEAKMKESGLNTELFDAENSPVHGENGDKSTVTSEKSGNESQKSKSPESHETVDASAQSENESQDQNEAAVDEPETFSDIDDAEVDGYLHNEEEKHFKKIIWEDMNKEYLQEQAAKEAAAAAAELEDFVNSSDGAQEKKAKKERKQRRTEDGKKSAPARTPFEATCNMLKRKGFGSKINMGAVEGLYTSDQDNRKKQKSAPDPLDEFGDTDGATENNEAVDGGDVGNDGEAEAFDDYYENGDEDYAYTENFDFDEND
ncbi:Transcription factor IIIB 90 kDa subunit [Ananas comosus]|uniref:Transcription factor IIIB 90 kDa subunit n=1 Tax=Ananas comosus TaxID=4615 RepID=A0A199VAF8_ANACO|nr:Transcription factor IIIB 90 kDa subunit [Ananas comosus]